MDDFAGTEKVREESRELFTALRDPSYNNFALLSVTFQGEATEAIVCINQNDDGTYAVQPLAVVVTDKMLDDLQDSQGRTPEEQPTAPVG